MSVVVSPWDCMFLCCTSLLLIDVVQIQLEALCHGRQYSGAELRSGVSMLELDPVIYEQYKLEKIRKLP